MKLKKQNIIIKLLIALIFLFMFNVVNIYADENSLTIMQEIEKCVELENNQLLMQQKIQISLKEEKDIESKEIEVVVPELQGKTPTVVGVMEAGQALPLELYQYNKDTMKLKIYGQNAKTYQIIYQYEDILIQTEEPEKVVLETIAKVKGEQELQAKQTQEEMVYLKGTIVSTSVAKTKAVYKGYLNANLQEETPYQEVYHVQISSLQNLDKLEINNSKPRYLLETGEKELLGTTYVKETILKKQNFEKIFGEEGEIVLKQGEDVLAVITKDTPTKEDGTIQISYEPNQVYELNIETSIPQNIGTLNIMNKKAIVSTEEIGQEQWQKVKAIEETIKVNDTEEAFTIDLLDPVAEAKLSINKEFLATGVENEIEIRSVLMSKGPKNPLYQNPWIEITLPDEVEEIKLQENDLHLLYEDELGIQNYYIQDNRIFVQLIGEQTKYKEMSIEGATIVINAKVKVNARVASNDSSIVMNYGMGKAKEQVQGEQAIKSIKIVAPKEITTIQDISDLSVETTGQEEDKNVVLEKEQSNKQMDAQIGIINNEEEQIKNVQILGDFPTDNQNNNMGITITKGISFMEQDGVHVYYTENEMATEDISKQENGWKEIIEDGNKVKKYLIIIDTLESKQTFQASYTINLPEDLEHNLVAKMGYKVIYQKNDLQGQNTLKATNIVLKTAVAYEYEVNLVASVGVDKLQNESTVKTGEVIHLQTQIVNTGTVEMQDVNLMIPIPEGVSYVEPKPNYEYTGSGYYQEVEKQTQEFVIDVIKPGETIIREFEVRINTDTPADKIINMQAQVTLGEQIKYSNSISCHIEKGNLRVSVKRVTDRKDELFSRTGLNYYVIIENISNQEQENVTVTSFVPEQERVEKLSLITGLPDKDISDSDLGDPSDHEEQDENQDRVTQVEGEQDEEDDGIITEELEYKETISIGALKPAEKKVLSYETFIQDIQEPVTISFYALANDGEKAYRSNVRNDNVDPYKISIQMTSEKANSYVKAGDIITYQIKIKNEGAAYIYDLELLDNIPDTLTITSIKIGEKESDNLSNNLSMYLSLQSQEEIDITIQAIIDDSTNRTQIEPITNQAKIHKDGVEIAKTDEITHLIEPSELVKPGEGSGDNSDNNSDNQFASGNKIISGIAWKDNNENGKKDDKESPLPGITAKLLNVETNKYVQTKDGEELESITDEAGRYIFYNIANGKYIVVFYYDDILYNITKYKVQDGAIVSHVMKNELTIDGEIQEVTSTDILQIKDDNIGNINIGLVERQKFDLKLEKYISKVTVQNRKETTVRGYNNSNLVKLELDAKQMGNTSVLIEYKIFVHNVGEIEGYAKKIVDYLPEGLEFKGELNKNWYLMKNQLYCTSLSNEEIKPGETKEITLVLVKNVTENNVGSFVNTAEIAEDYNELGIEDTNSIPNNQKLEENDMDSAEIILSIRTGAIYYYTAIITVIAIGVFVTIKIKKSLKRGKKEND